MKYIVIKFFTDLQDGNHPYNVGDAFPREGVTVTDERLQELSTAANRRGIPLIQAGNTEDDKTGDSVPPAGSVVIKAGDLPSGAETLGIVEGHFTEESLNKMTNPSLSKLATDLGLDSSKCKVKADFVALLATAPLIVKEEVVEEDTQTQ